ncbi:MAG: hypothetical protein R6U98_24930, partial [Pirellulaceae bacterium]
YWLYIITNCNTDPILQEPLRDPARLEWHEVKKVAHYSKPGRGLVIRATVTKQTETTTTLKAEATVEGEMIVTARLVLDRYTLEDRYPKRAATDAYMRRELRKQFDVLYDPSDAASAV